MNTSAQSAPQNWRLTLAYDGTDFRGWQIQPGVPTIQGELQEAIGRITGETPLPQGSGRTDAGVHALSQVASFLLRAPIPPENLVRALNRTLPWSIRVMEACAVPDSFHARHSAVAKTYEYRIFRGRICSPFLARYAYHLALPMEAEALEESARFFVGEHDFLSFAASDPDLSHRECRSGSEPIEKVTAVAKPPVAESGSTIKTIYSSLWEWRQTDAGEVLTYRVRGNGFLHHMVRNLVGTMLEAGRGQLRAEDIPGIIAARSRSAAGPTAPARGLFLHSVEYPLHSDGATARPSNGGDS
jgi:tRNA pseudouridine38-40 synthase